MTKDEFEAMFSALGRGEAIECLSSITDTWIGVTTAEIADPGRNFQTGMVREWRIKRVPVVVEGDVQARVHVTGHDPSLKLHVAPQHHGKMFHVVATEIIDEQTTRLKVGARVRTSKRLDLATDRGFLHGTYRVNSETGTVEEVSDNSLIRHGLCYGVRHNDGALGWYDNDELTVIP